MALFRHVAAGVFPGEAWTFTMHTEGSISTAAAQSAWVDATAALWTGNLDSLISTTTEMTEVTTAELNQATGQQITRLSEPVSRPGVAATTTLPPQLSIVVSLRSALATRAGRGRFYLPPFAVATVDVGRLLAASQAAVITACNAMFASLSGDLLQPVIYNRVPGTLQDITAYDVGDVFDTQRRRRNKLIEERSPGVV